MKYLILFYILVTTALYAQVAVTENEPSSLVEGIVSAVTGDLYALEDDIIIQGAEPLRLKRSYISSKGAGRWSFFENLQAVQLPPIRKVLVNEPNGTTLIYSYVEKIQHKKKKKQKELICHPLDLSADGRGLTNAAHGLLSAHTNLKNQYISLKNDNELLSVVCPNGTRRVYRAVPDQKPVTIFELDKKNKIKGYSKYYYVLESEELPNGNKTIYRWDNKRLTSIRTSDPSGQKNYAQATFHYHGKVKKDKNEQEYLENSNFDIHTSDGRTLQYRYFSEGHPKNGRWHLHHIGASDSPTEEMHYLAPENYRNQILSAVSLPNSRSLQISYYNPGANDMGVQIGDANDPICSRVKALSAPIGMDSTPIATHKFLYNPQSRMTSVLDVENIPTHYYWDENMRLTSVERFSTPQTLFCNTLFVWGANNTPDAANLICKVFKDENRKPIHATRYFYDGRGNVLEEKFYGNLTGEGISPTLDSNNLPLDNGVEAYAKKFEYTQDGRNLVLRKEEDNGLILTYEYLPGTDLPALELSYDHGQIKRRKIFEYNADRILIREITDDGNSSVKNNLSAVHTRLIREIHPKPDQPYQGMPHVIEEKYWDGKGEKLLKMTLLHYTTGGRISQKDIYDADGSFCYSLTYKYDEKGRIKEETNAAGIAAVSDYDELGNKIYFEDFGARSSSTMKYDYSNRLIESKEEGEGGLVRVTRHEYDLRHNKVLTVDPHGYETRYVYDPMGNLKETHLPFLEDLRPVISSTYDAAGREITRTDAKEYTTRTTYNDYGKPILIQHPDDTEEKFIYYTDGSLHAHIDQDGVQTTHIYDVFGRTTSKTTDFQGETLSHETFSYDGFHLIAKTDAEGNIMTYEYDGAGRKISETLNNEQIEYSYDSMGRLHALKKGALLSLTEYDVLDHVIEERKEDLHGKCLSKILYTYDDAGNKKTITRFIDGQEAIETLEYDAFNRLIEKREARGHITQIIYDDEHHQRTEIDPLGLQIIECFNAHYLLSSLEKRSSGNELLLREENFYDASGNLIAKETTLFNPPRTVTTLWDYGLLDRMSQLTEAAGTPEEKITTYSYTAKGLLFQTVKPGGTILTNTYDPLDRLSSQKSSDGTIHYTYIYNLLGHLLQSTDENAKTTLIRTCDPKGRLLNEKLPTHLSLKNTYDEQGRRTRLVLPDTSFITYDYDPLYLRRVTRYSPDGNLSYTHVYADYDLSGNLLSENLIGTIGSLLRTYDLNARPTSCASSHFSHEILQYDPVGNILASRLHNETLHYTYDDLYQLISEQDHAYQYDALCNRLQKDNLLYAPNALNQLPSEFKYNPDGNPYLHGDVHYTYDALDRLISIEDSSQRLTFTYDSLHRRLSKTVFTLQNGLWNSIQTTLFLYDGQNEIGSVDPSGSTRELRVLGRTPQAEIGSAIALELQGEAYAPFHDLHGNLAMLVSLSTNAKEAYRYTAFGEEKFPKPISNNPWRFTSKRTDDETSLVYFGRRYYLPAYGRWLTPDPLGLSAGPNLYAYVSNAPLTHVDLYGLFDTKEIDNFIKGSSNWKTSPNDFRQMAISAAHGVGEFGLNAGSAIATIGWGLTTPYRAVNWAIGNSTFSQDWNSFKQSNAAFYSAGESWMQRALPGDTNHDLYRMTRSVTNAGMEIGSLAIGGYAAARGVYSLAQGSYNAAKGMLGLQKISRPTMQMGDLSTNRKILFGQESVSKTFSHGEFAKMSISKVSEGLKKGIISPNQLPVDYLIKNNHMVAFNNRSLLALRRAKLEPSILNNKTGDPFFEEKLIEHLSGYEPSSTIRIRGGPPGTSWVGQ